MIEVRINVRMPVEATMNDCLRIRQRVAAAVTTLTASPVGPSRAREIGGGTAFTQPLEADMQFECDDATAAIQVLGCAVGVLAGAGFVVMVNPLDTEREVIEVDAREREAVIL